MKTKLALISLSILFLTTGCGAGSDQAKEDLTRACELVNARESTDNWIPDVAIEFFASAARENVDYLPLVQAAKLGQLPPTGINEIMTTSEVIKARSLVIGYCTPRIAK